MATPISKSKEALLTQEKLQQSHYYNPETGILYRRLRSGLKPVGTYSYGYLQCRINYKSYLVHRVAWLYMTGAWPEGEVDHIDGNPANNSWGNLRVGTNSDNKENLKRAHVNNLSTGLLGACASGACASGACASGNKFVAQIQVKGKKLYLGTFDTSEKAHQAYIEAKRKLHSFNTL